MRSNFQEPLQVIAGWLEAQREVRRQISGWSWRRVSRLSDPVYVSAGEKMGLDGDGERPGR